MDNQIKSPTSISKEQATTVMANVVKPVDLCLQHKTSRPCIICATDKIKSLEIEVEKLNNIINGKTNLIEHLISSLDYVNNKLEFVTSINKEILEEIHIVVDVCRNKLNYK